MKRALLVAVVALLTVCPASPAAGQTRLDKVETWAFAIGSEKFARDAERLADYDLVIVDGEATTARQVARLRGGGRIVLAYLSVGTIERWRGWYKRARPYRLDLWDDWGEWYADTSRRGFRRLIARRVAPQILAKGFDGLFLDNVDMIETHRRQRTGMRKLVAELSRQVHARGGWLFTQNGYPVMRPLVRYLDGWNREDVGYTYDFGSDRYRRQSAEDEAAALAELSAMRKRGLLTLATSYTNGAAPDGARAATIACASGALPFVSNIRLTRIPARGARCPA